MPVQRNTVALDGYPDLVVVYLGIRVNRLYGLRRLLGLGRQIRASWQSEPDGLLLHEDLVLSLVPMHLGMRQYWRDYEALERWTRSEPHRRWWQQFLKDSGGTGFWHETYFRRGGFEAIYDDMTAPVGMMRFAPVVPARGAMFSARHRAHMAGQLAGPVVPEQRLYADEDLPRVADG